MIGLETDRLSFRQWVNADYPLIESFFKAEENARYIGGVQKSEATWRLMASYIGHYELYGYSYLAVEEKDKGQLIGAVGLWNSDPWPEPELGYWLLPQWQRKGFGTEAAEAVKTYGKEQAKLLSLVSYINAKNKPSKKLAVRLGARLDSTIDLLDFGPHEVYRYW